jgi:hypothetical protein
MARYVTRVFGRIKDKHGTISYYGLLVVTDGHMKYPLHIQTLPFSARRVQCFTGAQFVGMKLFCAFQKLTVVDTELWPVPLCCRVWRRAGQLGCDSPHEQVSSPVHSVSTDSVAHLDSYPRNRPRRPAHFLDNRLTVNCKILATCSSTYSPVRTSQEAHSVSIK